MQQVGIECNDSSSRVAAGGFSVPVRLLPVRPLQSQQSRLRRRGLGALWQQRVVQPDEGRAKRAQRLQVPRCGAICPRSRCSATATPAAASGARGARVHSIALLENRREKHRCEFRVYIEVFSAFLKVAPKRATSVKALITSKYMTEST